MFSLFYEDTGLSEMLSPKTRTDLFNKSLEVQQSKPTSHKVLVKLDV